MMISVEREPKCLLRVGVYIRWQNRDINSTIVRKRYVLGYNEGFLITKCKSGVGQAHVYQYR